MKTVFFNNKSLWTIFILLSWTLTTAQEQQRILTKNFPLTANGKVAIDNSYGSVKLKSWNKNEVAIEVKITVKGGNRERAEEFLDEIDIAFDNSENEVRAMTQLPNQNRSWWKSWSFFGTKSLNYSIDYLVQMPQTAQLDIDNAYGNIYLDETDGAAQLECSYGRLDIGKLNHPQNTIDLAYAPSSSIDFINGGRIEADYSGLEIEQANRLVYEADFTKGNFGQITSLNFDADYGSLSIEEVASLVGEADYLTVRVDHLEEELDISMDYGSLSVTQIEASAKEVSVTADYTGIKLGADVNWPFSFTIETEYAGFRTDFPLDFSRKIIDGSEHNYQGKHLDGKNQLTLKADYGSIKLTKN